MEEEFATNIYEINSLIEMLNTELDSFLNISQLISHHLSGRIRPFGLENCDGDLAIEDMIQKSKNVLSLIRNLIIKLWQKIKDTLEWLGNLFDGTLRKLKSFQMNQNEKAKSTDPASLHDVKLTCYPKTVMQRRLEVLLKEVSLRWQNDNGTENPKLASALADIGFTIRIDNGKVKAAYNGVYPRLDSIAGHGYSKEDINRFLNLTIDLYEKFGDYKKQMIHTYDVQLKERYDRSANDEQEAQTILSDRLFFVKLHKTLTFVGKEIKEIGKEMLALCKATE